MVTVRAGKEAGTSWTRADPALAMKSEGGDTVDAGACVVELDVQALGRLGQIEVQDVTVALDENAVGVGDGD
jgi:hypothetical protein